MKDTRFGVIGYVPGQYAIVHGSPGGKRAGESGRLLYRPEPTPTEDAGFRPITLQEADMYLLPATGRQVIMPDPPLVVDSVSKLHELVGPAR